MSIRTRPFDYIRMMPMRAPEFSYSYDISIDKGPWRRCCKNGEILLFDTKEERDADRKATVARYRATKQP